nr:MAG TPA: hypothetical protein [Caudoviricetes sp.]
MRSVHISSFLALLCFLSTITFFPKPSTPKSNMAPFHPISPPQTNQTSHLSNP